MGKDDESIEVTTNHFGEMLIESPREARMISRGEAEAPIRTRRVRHHGTEMPADSE